MITILRTPTVGRMMHDVAWSAVGKKIVDVRVVSGKFDLNDDVIALVLDDGTEVFASMDAEGNGPGELFASLPNGDEIIIYFTRILKEA